MTPPLDKREPDWRYRQIRIQGGMMKLQKDQPQGVDDVFPILLENARLLEDGEMVVWPV